MVEPGRPKKTLVEETKKVALVFSLVLVTAIIQSTPAIAQNHRALDSADADFQLGAATSEAFGFTVFPRCRKNSSNASRINSAYGRSSDRPSALNDVTCGSERNKLIRFTDGTLHLERYACQAYDRHVVKTR